MWLQASSVVAAVLVLAGATGAAHGQKRVGVVVHAWPSAPVASEQVAAQLGRAAGADKIVRDVFGLAKARLRSGAVPARRLATFRRTRELMNEGWRAYLGVEVQFAAARLAAARASAAKVVDLAGGIELYAEVTLRLGVVRHHLKRAAQAAVLFRLAAVLNPSRVLSVAEFAPDVVAAYRAAVAVTPARLSVQVIVKLPRGPVGPGVVIEVDGKIVGGVGGGGGRGRSVGGRSVGGRSVGGGGVGGGVGGVGGKSVGGKSVGGKIVGGKSVGGKSVGGKSVGGKSVVGRSVASGQTTVSLRVGQHVFVARAPGYHSRGQVFAVDATTQRIQLSLDYGPELAAIVAGAGSVAIGTAEQPARNAVSAVMRYAELDAVLFVASVWRRNSPALLGQACAGLPVRCGRVVELRYPTLNGVGAAVRELWQATMATLKDARFPPIVLVDARLAEEQKRTKPGGKKVRPRRWWQSSWLWVGASAAATAVGAALLLSRDSQVMPSFGIRPCDFGGCL